MKLYGIKAKYDYGERTMYLVVVDRPNDSYAELIRKEMPDYTGKLAKFVPIAQFKAWHGKYLTSKQRATWTLGQLKKANHWQGVNIDYFTAFGRLDVTDLELFSIDMKE